MPLFNYHRNRLNCESLALEQLTNEYGTPLYVYFAASLRANITQMQTAFTALNALICFAVKANDNLAILRTIAAAGMGFDVVSGGDACPVRRPDSSAAAPTARGNRG
jgi:diaminopimelate decarboxylase|tara:strand:- start:43 stop:363 length:321 start_codon:yes stop_codon:yes gene_type:complete